MSDIFARSYIGGRDLFFGVPNLKGATIEKQASTEDNDDYITILTIKDVRGFTHTLQIRQQKV